MLTDARQQPVTLSMQARAGRAFPGESTVGIVDMRVDSAQLMPRDTNQAPNGHGEFCRMEFNYVARVPL